MYLRTLRAENALAAGDTEAARDHAAKAMEESREGRDYFVRLRAMCVVAECAISEDGSHPEFAQQSRSSSRARCSRTRGWCRR